MIDADKNQKRPRGSRGLSWLARGGLARHLGVFCVLLATTYLLVRFTPIPTDTWFVMPPLFFLYIGASLIAKAATTGKSSED